MSCGQSAQQKAELQRRHDDSIRAATKQELITQLKYNELIKLAQKKHDDSIKNTVKEKFVNNQLLDLMKSKCASIQQILINKDAQLTFLSNKLNADARFHFGRTAYLKEKQLRNDQIKIDSVKSQIAALQGQLVDLKSKIQQHIDQN